jgi:hypothetical protein
MVGILTWKFKIILITYLMKHVRTHNFVAST